MIKVNGLLISFFYSFNNFIVHFINNFQNVIFGLFSQMCNYIAIASANIVDTFNCYHIHIYFLLNLFQYLQNSW